MRPLSNRERIVYRYIWDHEPILYHEVVEKFEVNDPDLADPERGVKDVLTDLEENGLINKTLDGKLMTACEEESRQLGLPPE